MLVVTNKNIMNPEEDEMWIENLKNSTEVSYGSSGTSEVDGTSGTSGTGGSSGPKGVQGTSVISGSGILSDTERFDIDAFVKLPEDEREIIFKLIKTSSYNYNTTMINTLRDRGLLVELRDVVIDDILSDDKK